MDKAKLIEYLIAIDARLENNTILFIYGSAVLMLLDEIDRISLDIDVAAPYSVADYPDICMAAEAAGLPINPDEFYQKDHIEWIGPLRLCLAPPDSETDLVLWKGKKLTVKTVSVPDLIASKLIRYDEADQSDIRYLYQQTNPSLDQLEHAVSTLPGQFKSDSIVQDNFSNLKIDIKLWKSDG